MSSKAKRSRNRRARRFRLAKLIFEGELMNARDGEVIIRLDSSVGITLIGSARREFMLVGEWKLSPEQKVEAGASIFLVGYKHGVSFTCMVTLGEETTAFVK